MAITNTLTELLTEQDVARITGLSVATMRRRRLLRQPPLYKKLGAAVRYHPGDVAAWINAQPTGGGHQTEAQ
jgi:predicted DNA-binding transcriptional regulator AlpA